MRADARVSAAVEKRAPVRAQARRNRDQLEIAR
jgi:hypothetical protein